MTEDSLSALYVAILRRATAVSELWGTNIFPDQAPANTARPYVVFFYSGGGELNAIVGEDAEYVITIKGVSDHRAEAFTIAARLRELFNDAGLSRTVTLDGGTYWDILNATRERQVHLVENDNGRQIYHSGAQYRFRMEAK